MPWWEGLLSNAEAKKQYFLTGDELQDLPYQDDGIKVWGCGRSPRYYDPRHLKAKAEEKYGVEGLKKKISDREKRESNKRKREQEKDASEKRLRDSKAQFLSELPPAPAIADTQSMCAFVANLPTQQLKQLFGMLGQSCPEVIQQVHRQRDIIRLDAAKFAQLEPTVAKLITNINTQQVFEKSKEKLAKAASDHVHQTALNRQILCNWQLRGTNPPNFAHVGGKLGMWGGISESECDFSPLQDLSQKSWQDDSQSLQDNSQQSLQDSTLDSLQDTSQELFDPEDHSTPISRLSVRIALAQAKLQEAKKAKAELLILSKKERDRLYSEKRRRALRNGSPRKLSEQREKDRKRSMEYRVNLTPNRRTIQNEKSCLRMKRYRDKKKEKGRNIHTRKERENLRKKWREQKRAKSMALTEEQLIEQRRKRREYYARKKKRNLLPEFQETIDNTQATKIDETGTKQRARKRVLHGYISRTVKDIIRKMKKDKSKKGRNKLRDFVHNFAKHKKNDMQLRKQLDISHWFYKSCSEMSSYDIENVNRETKYSQEEKLEIQDFFREHARMLPLKKSVKNGKQKMVLEDKGSSVHSQYLHSKGGNQNKMCRSHFLKLKPSNVLSINHDKFITCMCEFCVNIEHTLLSLKEIGRRKDFVIPSNKYELLDKVMCGKLIEDVFYARDCIERNCSDCKDALAELLAPIANIKEEVNFKNWTNAYSVDKNGKRSNMKILKEEVLPVGEIVNILKKLAEKLPSHLFSACFQRKQFATLKENLPANWVLSVADFSENFRCIFQDEPQAAHYHYTQCTVYPVVAYYRCECNEVIQENVIFISNDLKHDAHMVDHFTSSLENHLITRGITIDKHVQFSDGCPKEFKSKTPFFLLSKREIPMERCFFGSRHGKNESDGVGGVTKRAATDYIKSRKGVIHDASDLFSFLEKHMTKDSKATDSACLHKKQTFHFINDVKRTEDIGELVTLRGTQHHIHCVKSTGQPGVVQASNYTCYCLPCIENSSQCIYAKYVDAPIEHKLIKETNEKRKPKRAVKRKASGNETVNNDEKRKPKRAKKGKASVYETINNDEKRKPKRAVKRKASGNETVNNDEKRKPKRAKKGKASVYETINNDEKRKPKGISKHRENTVETDCDRENTVETECVSDNTVETECDSQKPVETGSVYETRSKTTKSQKKVTITDEQNLECDQRKSYIKVAKISKHPGWIDYQVIKKSLEQDQELDFIDPDGNCYFRCVSKFLHGTESYHQTLRKAIVNFMKENVSDFAMFIQGDIMKHFKKMARLRSWATESEIYATSSLLDREIYVLTPQLNTYKWCLFKPIKKYVSNQKYLDGCRCFISICNTGGTHYDLISKGNTCNCGHIPPVLEGVVASISLDEYDESDVETTCDSEKPVETECDREKPVETDCDRENTVETDCDCENTVKTECVSDDNVETECDSQKPVETECDSQKPVETDCDRENTIETECDRETPVETDCDRENTVETECVSDNTVETECDRENTVETDCDRENTVETECVSDNTVETECDRENTVKTECVSDNNVETECDRENTVETDCDRENTVETECVSENTVETECYSQKPVETDCDRENTIETECDRETPVETDCDRENTVETECVSDNTVETECDRENTVETECVRENTVETECVSDNTVETECDRENTVETECDRGNTVETDCDRENTVETECVSDNTVETECDRENTVETDCDRENTVETECVSENTVETECDSQKPVETDCDRENTIETECDRENTVKTECVSDNNVETECDSRKPVETDCDRENTIETECDREKPVETDCDRENTVETECVSDNTVETECDRENTVETECVRENTVETECVSDNTVETECDRENTVETECDRGNTVETDCDRENTVETECVSDNTVETECDRENTVETDCDRENTVETECVSENTVETECDSQKPVETDCDRENTIETECDRENTVKTECVSDNNVETECDSRKPVETDCDRENTIETECDREKPVETDCDRENTVETECVSDNTVETECDRENTVETECVRENTVETECVSDNTVETECDRENTVETDCDCENTVETECVSDNTVETECDREKPVETECDSENTVETESVATESVDGQQLPDDLTNAESKFAFFNFLRLVKRDREKPVETECDRENTVETECDREKPVETECDRENTVETECDRENTVETECDRENTVETECAKAEESGNVVVLVSDETPEPIGHAVDEAISDCDRENTVGTECVSDNTVETECDRENTVETECAKAEESGNVVVLVSDETPEPIGHAVDEAISDCDRENTVGTECVSDNTVETECDRENTVETECDRENTVETECAKAEERFELGFNVMGTVVGFTKGSGFESNPMMFETSWHWGKNYYGSLKLQVTEDENGLLLEGTYAPDLPFTIHGVPKSVKFTGRKQNPEDNQNRLADAPAVRRVGNPLIITGNASWMRNNNNTAATASASSVVVID